MEVPRTKSCSLAKEHGDRSVRQNVHCLTPEHQAQKAASAVRDHDNQITSPAAGGLQNPLSRVFFLAVARSRSSWFASLLTEPISAFGAGHLPPLTKSHGVRS
jgi:hypothetical protein